MCLWDDVEAAESGLAGFLREGRQKAAAAAAETERKRSQNPKTGSSSACLTAPLCNNLCLLVSDTLGFSGFQLKVSPD